MAQVSSTASLPLSTMPPSQGSILKTSVRRRLCTAFSITPCSSTSPPTDKQSQSSYQQSPRSNLPPNGGEQPPLPDLNQKCRDVSRLLGLFGHLALRYCCSEPFVRRDLAGLALLQSGTGNMFSYVQRDFWNALNTRDLDLFLHHVQFFFLALLYSTPVVVYYQFLRDSCSLP